MFIKELPIDCKVSIFRDCFCIRTVNAAYNIFNRGYTVAIIETYINVILFWNKWVNSIFSSKCFLFSYQLLLTIPVYELNNRLAFLRTWAIDVQSVSGFYSSFMIFLARGPLSIYFLLFFLEKCLRSRAISALCSSSSAENKKAGSISVQPWLLWSLISSTQIRLYIRYTQTETLL